MRYAILAAAIALLLAACGSQDDAANADPLGTLCAPPASSCSTVTACDHAQAFTCGNGRAQDSGYGCAPWYEHAAADCPLQYELCRASDGTSVLCPRG